MVCISHSTRHFVCFQLCHLTPKDLLLLMLRMHTNVQGNAICVNVYIYCIFVCIHTFLIKFNIVATL